jgi:DNA (cytosine-5)-methyltransferase 1
MMDNTKMTLGSLFDGSGGFPLGGILAGIEPVFSSEIEPFPILVTHKRLPQVKHYGDVSRLSGAELPPVDIITFGSPCQDLSIAGKRAGIHDGDRSNLFFQAIRIIKEMRDATNGRYPRYCVWENVPGAFSSNGGDDFKAVLEAVIGVKEEGIEVPSPENHRWPKSDVYLGNGWSVAYRVFDAQYWGVPQRRARIYLVADLAGGSAGEVLFKSEGVSGYTPQGFRSWQGAAGGAEEGAGETGGRSDAGGGTLCVNCQGTSGVGITEEMALALVAQDHGNHPAVLHAVGIDGYNAAVTDDTAATLGVNCGMSTGRNGVLQAAGFSTEHSAMARSIGYEEEISPTLRAGVVPAALSVENHPTDGRIRIREDDTCQTLCSRAGTGGNNVPLVAEPVTLKIRSGCEGGGKGALWQRDMSATLGTHNDQTLFQPEVRAYGVCSKHSNAMMSDNPHSGFYEATTSRTLDQSGGNSVTSNQGGICVVAPAPETFDVRFTSDGTKNARGHCYQTGISRCLDTSEANPDSNHGGVAVVALEPGAASRVGGHVYSDGKSGTLRANAGDNQQAVVMPETFSLQGSMIGRTDQNGPQGDGINEDVCFTLNTTDRHAVAAPDPSYTISRDNHFAVSEDVSVTAVARGPATVAAPSADHYCTSKNSHHTVAAHEQANTLVASDWKDPPLVNDLPNDEPVYIVRRLTPVECARLQGFPDWWCADLAIPDPTDADIAFWSEVWETWRQVTNPKGKPKTEKQIRKWLADPYTDSAEYKLWGNGVALPCTYFVLSGIAWAAQRDTQK